jgi:hypothetical protein
MSQTVKSPVKFERNGFYERLIHLRRTNRKAFDSLSPQTKLSLGHYEEAKLKAEEDERRRG